MFSHFSQLAMYNNFMRTITRQLSISKKFRTGCVKLLIINSYTLSVGVRFRTIEPNTSFKDSVPKTDTLKKNRLSCNFANYKSYDGKIFQINQYLRTESIVLAVSATVVVYCYL